jgi:C4-dicarboxylate transporter DctM subunit
MDLAVVAVMVGFFVGSFMGIPIAWVLGICGLAGVLLLGVPLDTVPQKIYYGMDSFILLCIPFFILAGEIMTYGGLAKRLLNFGVATVGFVRGGLGCANVVASMIFGGITGSAIADASALGPLTIRMMVDNGYDRSFSAGLIAASACIGPIIPPSIPVLVYAMAVSGTSIGGMFAAGIIPGTIIGIGLMITCIIISSRRNYPKREQKMTVALYLATLRDGVLAILMPVIILGGILSGIFTPTEAAAVSVVYAFVVCFFVYRELKLSDLPKMCLTAGLTSAVVMIIIGTSNVFGMIVAFEQVGLKVKVLLLPLGPYGFILVTNVVFLILGTFLDMNPAILIFAPVFAPIAVQLGIHPIHFGIIIVINLVIGLITPPLGAVLFTVVPIARVRFEDLIREVLPFLLIEIVVLFLVSFVPALVMTIPRVLGYG